MKSCPNGHKWCPHPQTDGLDEIEFTPEPDMVDWLGPAQLADTGLKAVIAATFGNYADKREVEVAVSPYDPHQPPPFIDYSTKPDLTFDYVADLGDGFNPTYAMACLLAKDQLKVGNETLPNGEFVMLGGDEIYPTAKRDEYQNKFIGPYRSALPWREKGREIFALPGNHDWYDGLNSFLRIFCQGRESGDGARWIGAWRATQRRSYFAIRLPNDWWVWAIDGQLESDMDKPQLEYFELLGKWIMDNKGAGEPKVILLTPEPNWVYCGTAKKTLCAVKPERFDTYAHFEKRYIRARGLRLAMTLSGDLHHYVRYTSEDGAHFRVTSGGGGAYLFGTHQMPDSIVVREGTTELTVKEEPRRTYTRTQNGKERTYPDLKTSRSIARGVAKLPFHNWTFGLFLAIIYVLFAWTLQSSSRGNKYISEGSLFEAFLNPQHTMLEKLKDVASAFVLSPASIIFLAVVVGALWGYTSTEADGKSSALKWLGAVHGLLHIFVAVVLMWVSAMIIGEHVTGLLWRSGAMIALMLVFGWLAGSIIWALWLYIISATTGGHFNDLFSSQALEGWKHFLRFHMQPDGSIKVYAIGLDEVPSKWTFQPDRDCSEPFFAPAGGATLDATMIDDPFVLR